MVIAAYDWVSSLAQTGVPMIRRLEPEVRAKVLAALAGLIILGFALVLLTWLGGRATRRYMASGIDSDKPPVDPDDWAKKTLHEHQDLDS